jgi:DNA-directed RNA polymerase subunit A'
VIAYSEVDFDSGIILHLDADKMKDRGVEPEEITTVVQSGKKEVEYSKKNNTVTIQVEGSDIPTLFALRNKSLNQKVKGIPGIERVTVVKEEEEWMIQTSGSNLAKVLRTLGVDSSRTTTNSIFEVATTLGIEAARTALINEITSTLDEQGLEVDIRHLLLVADLMTSKGLLQQIGRHGIAGKKPSVLARAAFEITVPTLAEASVTGQVEELKGVTENVIVGMIIPVGTGMTDLYMKR